MIKATELVTEFIRSQKSIEEFAQRADISRSAVYALLNGKHPSSDTIVKVLTITGFEFEKAFEVRE